MGKHKYYDDTDYDIDDYDNEDYDDIGDECDIDDINYDDEDTENTITFVEDDENATSSTFNEKEHKHMDLPSDISRSFNPADYDFTKIMEDYHSGDIMRKKHAIEQAVYAMDALVKHVINRHYPTYREHHYEDMLQTGRMAVVNVS